MQRAKSVKLFLRGIFRSNSSRDANRERSNTLPTIVPSTLDSIIPLTSASEIERLYPRPSYSESLGTPSVVTFPHIYVQIGSGRLVPYKGKLVTVTLDVGKWPDSLHDLDLAAKKTLLFSESCSRVPFRPHWEETKLQFEAESFEFNSTVEYALLPLLPAEHQAQAISAETVFYPSKSDELFSAFVKTSGRHMALLVRWSSGRQVRNPRQSALYPK